MSQIHKTSLSVIDTTWADVPHDTINVNVSGSGFLTVVHGSRWRIQIDGGNIRWLKVADEMSGMFIRFNTSLIMSNETGFGRDKYVSYILD